MSQKSLIDKLSGKVWSIIKAVFTSNRDYPYHDYTTIADGSEPAHYQVGTNNVDANGDINKRFVSKSTLLICDGACTVRLNSPDNTPMVLLADVAYTFKSNITHIYVTGIESQCTLYCYFEGVLPQETRDAE